MADVMTAHPPQTSFDTPLDDLSGFVTPLSGNIRHMDLAVEGMRCAGCMAKVEREMGKLDGVTKARVNFASRRLVLEWHDAAQSPQGLVAVLEKLGFRAYPFDPAALEKSADQEGRQLLRCLAIAGFAAANIMLLSVSVWSGNASDITSETRDLFHLLSALIAIPAAYFAGQPFFRSAASAIKARTLNMDVPISLAVVLAISMSLYQTFTHAHHAYFDSAIMLLFFLLIGRYLDHMMRRKTRDFAQNLAALKAEKASLIGSGGVVRDIPVSAVETGDRVLVRAGERIAVDGIVEEGTSEIDQAMVTGETAFAPAGPGMQVYAGTLNMGGALTVRVTAADSGTLLDEVNALLEKAGSHRHRFVALADRAAQVYAPFVHAIAALTFAGWMALGAGWEFSLLTAIAVLIITCPCALGLAVPAVQVVASGLLFRHGVLLNGGDALERLADADMVVFDKTGTLTLPVHTLDDGLDDAEGLYGPAMQAARRLALSSRHPLAAALTAEAGDLAPYDNAQEEAGRGISAEVEGQTLRLGSADFVAVSDEAHQAALRAHPLSSLIWFRAGEAPARPIAVRQTLRADAVETVKTLRDRLGLEIEILSGDRDEAVAEAARALGVATWQAALKPADKIAYIEALQASGRKVLMVGDGLNDAPALAAAHVSLSPITAVHLSQAAADAVFTGDALAPVASAVRLSRGARRIMAENLWLSAGYNFIAVPVAVLGFVTPLIAALAMSGSSVIVTLNALRMRFSKG
jgi:Cu2+-exporting ATPase